MALLDGKQIRNESTSLDKLQGHSGMVTFTASATMSFENGAVLRRETADILVATDVVNKEYVDSIAAGLDPKESVKVIATSSVVLSGTSSIDGYVLQLGDRILVNGQAGVSATASNGIYVVSAGPWSRAADSDGTPSSEVSYGNFVFVEEGTVYGGSGWVLSISDSSDSYILVGTESQLWVQFSSAGYYTAGDGLSLVGSEFSITNTGVSANTYGAANQAVTFTVNSSGQLTSASTQSIAITSGQVTDFDSAAQTSIFTDANFVDGITVTFSVTAGDSVTAEVVNGSLGTSKIDTNGAGATAGYILSNDGSGNFVWIVNDAGDITEVTAGAGLTGGGVSGAVTLDVQTTNGISIVGDSVALGGTLSQNTTIAGAGYDFTLGNADVILMTGSTFDVEVDGFISLDAGTGSVQILANDNIVVSGATVDMVGTFSVNTVVIDPVGALNGQALIYDGTKFAPATVSGDISGVTAGAGLSGGGSSGFIQLDVELTTNGGLTFSGSGDSGTLQVDYTSVANQLDGAGLIANGTTLDVSLGVNSGLTFSGDSIIVDPTIAGNGLDFTSGVLTVNTSEINTALAGNGLTANGSALDVNVNSDSLEIVGDVVRLKDTVTGDRTFTGSVNIGGNLTVSGTATYINTENLYVEDNIITLNATFSGSPILDAGIEVNRGSGTYAVMYWDETNDYWKAGLSGSNNYVVTQAGTGLSQNFDTLSVNFTQVATNLQGNGLTANGGVLDVNVGNGISISSDVVELGGTLTKNTIIDANLNDLSIGDLNTLTFTASGSPGVSSGLIVDGTTDSSYLKVTDGVTSSQVRAGYNSISLSAASNGITSALQVRNHPQTLGGLDGSSGNYMLIKDGLGSKGLVYEGDYTSNFTTYSLITKQYVDQQVLAAGTITSIVAGNGLTGGGTSGTVTLAVNAGDGIELVGDSVAVNLVNTNSGLEFVTGELQVDLAANSGLTLTGGLQIDSSAAGNGLAFASGIFSVNTANGLTINGDNVEIDSTAAGNGLTFSAGVFAVNAANGLQISGDNVEVAPSIAGTGLTFSTGVLSVIAGNAQPVYSQRNLTPSATPANTNNANSGLTIANTPNDYSRVSVYVNGQLQYLGNGTASNVDCYFGSTAGVAESISNITSGQTLWWNGGPGGAGFRLQTSDRIDIIYEV